MIGETKKDIDNSNEFPKWLIPIRDATVTFFVVLISNLITNPTYPPDPSLIYASILSALLIALVSYGHSVGIKIDRGSKSA